MPLLQQTCPGEAPSPSYRLLCMSFTLHMTLLGISAGSVLTSQSISGLGRSPGEGNGNPLQYSCLENPMDRGAWWAACSPWGCRIIGHNLATKPHHCDSKLYLVITCLLPPSPVFKFHERQVPPDSPLSPQGWVLGDRAC